MTEILRDNFEENFNEVHKDLKDSAFISIDAEFSGLQASNELKSSLFDSAEERYVKQRENVSDFLILQFGLTAFIFDRENNTYTSKTYCFYLFPHTFGSVDEKFKCQASSFEFLCHHKFDFNKFVYNGISFINAEQDKRVQQELKDGQLFRLVERALSHADEEAVQALCSQVALWLAGGKPAEEATEKSMVLQVPKSSQSSQCIAYVVHHELRRRFVSIWTLPEEGNVRVLKVSGTERAMMENNLSHEAEMQNAVLLSLRGFSRLFRLLAELKKPLIAHNCILDFMIMYKQFHQPLPKSYQRYKDRIHNLFPVIYDTKHISSEFKKKVDRANSWTSNALEPLYNYFTSGKGFLMVPCTPLIQSKDYSLESGPKYHDAGWDSYCAGVCFIRMAHFFGALELGRITLARPFTSTEHLAFTAHLANRINVIRGTVSHIVSDVPPKKVLDGPDPPSHRPEVVVVKRRNGGRLDPIDLTERFSKHGSVDVKLITEKLALVAASTNGIVRDICKEYYKNPDLVVVKYNRLQHNPTIWVASWSGLVLMASLTGFIMYRALKHST